MSSWVIRHRTTKKVECETYNKHLALFLTEGEYPHDALFSIGGNVVGLARDYEAVPLLDYLEGLNAK